MVEDQDREEKAKRQEEAQAGTGSRAEDDCRLNGRKERRSQEAS